MNGRNIKTNPPAVPSDIVYRERLFSELNDYANKRLIIVSAGAGWGKTTLMSSFLSKYNLDHVWYNISEDDRDIVYLLSNLAVGISKLFPKSEPLFSENLQMIRQPTNNDPYIIVHSFLNRVVDSDRPVFFVFDDFQLVMHEDTILRAFVKMLDLSPPNLTLVILTRSSNTNLPISKYEAYGEVKRLNQANLKFSDPEIQQYLSEIKRSDIDGNVLAKISEISEGWAVALRLISHSSWAFNLMDSDTALNLQADFRSIINRYIDEQFFENLPDDTKDFLLKTSIFDTFTEDQCTAIFQIQEFKSKIDFLMSNGCPLKRTESKDSFYEYHQILRSFLLKRLYRQYNEEGVKVIYRKTAEFFRNNNHELAFGFFIKAGEFSTAADILAKDVMVYIGGGNARAYLTMFNLLPADTTDKIAILRFVQGWAFYVLGMISEAEEKLEKAIEIAVETDDRLILGMAINHLQAVCFFKDDYQKAIQLAEHFSDKLDYESAEYLGLQRYRAMCLIQVKQKAEAERWWNEIETHPLVKNSFDVYIQNVSLKSTNYYYMVGDFENARQICQKAIDYFSKQDLFGHLSRYLLYRGLFEHEVGNFEEADRLLVQCNENLNSTGQKLPKCLVLSFYADNALDLGKPKEAAEAISEAEELLTGTPTKVIWKSDLVYYSKSVFARHLKKRSDFFKFAATAVKAILQKRIPVDVMFSIPKLALGYAELGEVQKGINLLLESINVISFLGESFARSRIELLLASLYFDLSEYDTALQHLNRSLAISEKKGYDFLYTKKEVASSFKLFLFATQKRLGGAFALNIALRTDALDSNLVETIALSGDTEYSLLLLNEINNLGLKRHINLANQLYKYIGEGFKSHAKKVLTSLNQLPSPPLKIGLFGPLTLTRDGIQIEDEVWSRKSAKSIFKYLVFHCGKKIKSDVLIDVFYSNQSLASAKKNLHQAMSVVRKALEPEIAPKQKSSYLVYDMESMTYRLDLPEKSQVDLVNFNQHIDIAEQMQKQPGCQEQIQHYLSALTYCEGELLEEDRAEAWTSHDTVRFKLQSVDAVVVKLMLKVANWYLLNFDYAKCEKLISTLLEKDPFNENTWFLLMKCKRNQGDRISVLNAYNELKESMQHEYGVSVREDIQALYSSIRNPSI